MSVVMTQGGKGLAEDLIKIASPLIVQQAQVGLQDIQRGQSLADTWSNHWRDHLWQVHHSALSLVVHLLPIGPQMDERRDHFLASPRECVIP